ATHWRVETLCLDACVRSFPRRSLAMLNSDNVKKILVYLSLAFVIVSVWRDPAGSADAAGAFLSSVGSFFGTVIDKSVAFLKGLTD
ncbi:hypothetical protein, partial [Escherichia coli]|uniref:hypothetical protein n=1 Tax=Escherichia coli TaxID=562 RepID=UPI0022AC6222